MIVICDCDDAVWLSALPQTLQVDDCQSDIKSVPSLSLNR